MEDHSHRWSELIPPHTALTFAALWDPEEGMVTFSGGHLLESDHHHIPNCRDLPRDAYDGQSTILTLDGFSLPFSYSAFGNGRRARVPTVTFTFNALDDTHSQLDPFMASHSRLPTSHDKRQPSAYFDWSQFRSVGKTIYSLARAPLERRMLNTPKARCDESDMSTTDDGFFEEAPMTAGTFSSAPMLVNLNLKSTFSMTTTSTTGYVDIDTPSVYSHNTTAAAAPSEAWSTLQGIDFESLPNGPFERTRRLQKPRKGPHILIPVDPAEVLARPTYNHVVDQPGPCRLKTSDGGLACPGLRRFKSLPKLPNAASIRPSHKASVSPVSTSSISGPPDVPPLPTLPITPTRASVASPWQTFPAHTPPSPSRSAGRGRPQLKRQKSVAKVVLDSVGRLTSRCRSVRINADATSTTSRAIA